MYPWYWLTPYGFATSLGDVIRAATRRWRQSSAERSAQATMKDRRRRLTKAEARSVRSALFAHRQRAERLPDRFAPDGTLTTGGSPSAYDKRIHAGSGALVGAAGQITSSFVVDREGQIADRLVSGPSAKQPDDGSNLADRRRAALRKALKGLAEYSEV